MQVQQRQRFIAFLCEGKIFIHLIKDTFKILEQMSSLQKYSCSFVLQAKVLTLPGWIFIAELHCRCVVCAKTEATAYILLQSDLFYFNRAS